jgi:hypothetical protein
LLISRYLNDGNRHRTDIDAENISLASHGQPNH